jgi:hypothetical protein
MNMIKLRYANFFAGLALMAISGGAAAEWTRFASNEASVIYVDEATRNKSADMASIWILRDFGATQLGPSREKFKSAKIFYEFKCAEGLGRQSYLTRHYAAMGGAGALSSDRGFHPWMSIVDGTEIAKLFIFSCKEK